MIKVGLVGCGGIGTTHAHAYMALKDRVEVVAVADVVPEKAQTLAEFTGAKKIYASGNELIENEKLDFIDVALPTYLHTAHAVKAMRKGMNVFLEKPVCMNEEEAQLLLKTEEETGVRVQIGLCCRFNNECNYLKNLIDKNTYGKLLALSLQRISPRPMWSWENWYLDPDKSGSMALDLHVHNADFVRYLMGEPQHITAKASRGQDGSLDHIYVAYEYENSIAVVEDGWGYPACFRFSESYCAKFEKATVIWDKDGVTVFSEEGKEFKPEIQAAYAASADLGINITSLGEYFNELNYFVTMLEKGEKPTMATLSDSVESMRLVWKEIEQCGGRKI